MLYSRQKAVSTRWDGKHTGVTDRSIHRHDGAPGVRYMAVAKSPLTGGWGEANSGGFFGPNLKLPVLTECNFTGVSPSRLTCSSMTAKPN